MWRDSAPARHAVIRWFLLPLARRITSGSLACEPSFEGKTDLAVVSFAVVRSGRGPPHFTTPHFRLFGHSSPTKTHSLLLGG